MINVLTARFINLGMHCVIYGGLWLLACVVLRCWVPRPEPIARITSPPEVQLYDGYMFAVGWQATTKPVQQL